MMLEEQGLLDRQSQAESALSNQGASSNQETFCFGRALTHVKVGGKAMRVSNPDWTLCLREGTLRVGLSMGRDGTFPFFPLNDDLLAEDWVLL